MALERRFEGADGVKLALERRFGRPDGAKLALEQHFGRPEGKKLFRFLRRPEVPTENLLIEESKKGQVMLDLSMTANLQKATSC